MIFTNKFNSNKNSNIHSRFLYLSLNPTWDPWNPNKNLSALLGKKNFLIDNFLLIYYNKKFGFEK